MYTNSIEQLLFFGLNNIYWYKCISFLKKTLRFSALYNGLPLSAPLMFIWVKHEAEILHLHATYKNHWVDPFFCINSFYGCI